MIMNNIFGEGCLWPWRNEQELFPNYKNNIPVGIVKLCDGETEPPLHSDNVTDESEPVPL